MFPLEQKEIAWFMYLRKFYTLIPDALNKILKIWCLQQLCLSADLTFFQTCLISCTRSQGSISSQFPIPVLGSNILLLTFVITTLLSTAPSQILFKYAIQQYMNWLFTQITNIRYMFPLTFLEPLPYSDLNSLTKNFCAFPP